LTDSELNKEKENTILSKVDKLFASLFAAKFKKRESNRDLKFIIHDRNLMRVDSSNVFDPENVKIYM
jgi:hypothetical protein